MESKLGATEERMSSLQVEVDRLRGGQLEATDFSSEREQWEMDRAVKQQKNQQTSKAVTGYAGKGRGRLRDRDENGTATSSLNHSYHPIYWGV